MDNKTIVRTEIIMNGLLGAQITVPIKATIDNSMPPNINQYGRLNSRTISDKLLLAFNFEAGFTSSAI